MYHHHCIVLKEVDSTNNYANRLIVEGKGPEGTVVLSGFQNHGRGQAGNRWESAPGMNLLASFILHPGFLPPNRQFYLSKLVSLAVFDWLSEQIPDVAVKWPNDIYAGKKKIAGILLETNVLGNRLHSAVAGIGLNLNQTAFDRDLPNPVALKQLTGCDYDPVIVASAIREKLFSWYEHLKSGSLTEIDSAYRQRLFLANTWASFRKGDAIWQARICGIGEYGQLQLEDRQGQRTEHFFKEIEYVL